MENWKENNVWHGLSMNTIYNMDCIEWMKLIPDWSIDCIITSPPYNIWKMHSNHKYFWTYWWNDMNESEYQSRQISFIDECIRVLKDDWSLFYNHKIRIKNKIAIHPMERILKTKWILKQEITWDLWKSANSDRIRFFPYSERIYRIVKQKETKIFNKKNLSDVWRVVPIHKRQKTNHIAVMPEKIVHNIINATQYTTFLDPFMWSWTTAIACINTNRNFIWFELDEWYRNIANKRIQDKLSEK